MALPGSAAPEPEAEQAIRAEYRCLGRFDAVGLAAGVRYAAADQTFWVRGEEAIWQVRRRRRRLAVVAGDLAQIGCAMAAVGLGRSATSDQRRWQVGSMGADGAGLVPAIGGMQLAVCRQIHCRNHRQHDVLTVSITTQTLIFSFSQGLAWRLKAFFGQKTSNLRSPSVFSPNVDLVLTEYQST